MRLTILGASAATQNPGGACSSYLVQEGQAAVVMDMGSGAFANLQRHIAPDDVTAVVLSHLHADHVLDLMPYRYWLEFQGAARRRRPRLLVPPGGERTLRAISSLQDPSPTFFSDVFEVAEYDPTQAVMIDGLTLRFHPVRHAPHTYGMRVAAAGCVLAYSADSGPFPGLVEVAQDADLFLCENANHDDSDFPLHLKPREAGDYARQAGARRLVLTHRWHLYGFDEAQRSASDVFGGPVTVAREGDTYTIGR